MCLQEVVQLVVLIVPTVILLERIFLVSHHMFHLEMVLIIIRYHRMFPPEQQMALVFFLHVKWIFSFKYICHFFFIVIVVVRILDPPLWCPPLCVLLVQCARLQIRFSLFSQVWTGLVESCEQEDGLGVIFLLWESFLRFFQFFNC